MSGPETPTVGTDEAAERRYILQLTRTAAGTGFFAPRPEGDPGFETALTRLRHTPLDSFLHQYLLQDIVTRPVETLATLARTAGDRDRVLRALLFEAAYLKEDPGLYSILASSGGAPAPIEATPLIYLRHRLLADRESHRYWIAKLADNILHHRPLTFAGGPDVPPLPPGLSGKGTPKATVPVAAISPAPKNTAVAGVSVTDTIATALERLHRLNLLVSGEMRHEASLSPIALMRQWRLERRVNSGALAYRLGGFMTAYGRGLTLETARASCLMEIVERYSAFGDFCPDTVAGHPTPVPLVRARLEEMRQAGRRVLDPEALELEAPRADAPLYWRPARIVQPEGRADIWVPAQCVYLFCNLDEPDLFSALGSTGLAAGNTLAQARLSGLLEIIERDAEAVTPFDPAACFTVGAQDPPLKDLLARYRQSGIHLQFQDLTGALGVPCYKCFVVDPQGRIVKGTGAHLSGRRALIAALTETMYPYPNGPASRPGLQDLPVRPLSSLPDFGSGSAAGDLDRIERLLMANGLYPIYADLTRADLGLPVVRALVPGLTITADFDRFSRLSTRLANGLNPPSRRAGQGVDSLRGSQ